MKRVIRVVLALVFIGKVSGVQAALQSLPVSYQQLIYEDGVRRTELQTQSQSFLVEILSDDEGLKREQTKNGRPEILVKNGERYSIRLHNPLPVRVAVNLTVDGLNTISGKPCGISDGNKWIIDPWSFITIRGWQVTEGSARRFYFTEKPKSYAKWRGKDFNRDLSVNCGVIGAAYFWNSEELNQYYASMPVYRSRMQHPASAPEQKMKSSAGFGSATGMFEQDAVSQRGLAKEKSADKKAGTGMGERESHSTQLVDFTYNSGMYQLAQAIVISYDFAKDPQPNPFPNLSYAPQMPY